MFVCVCVSGSLSACLYVCLSVSAQNCVPDKLDIFVSDFTTYASPRCGPLWVNVKNSMQASLLGFLASVFLLWPLCRTDWVKVT